MHDVTGMRRTKGRKSDRRGKGESKEKEGRARGRQGAKSTVHRADKRTWRAVGGWAAK